MAERADSPQSHSGRPTKRKFTDSEEKIVWPPVVIIENTLTHFDEQGRIWKGLENEEIRTFLKSFKDIQFGSVKASYGPRGNRGKSLVIFPATPSGYMDAQSLSDILERDQRGRRDWRRVQHIKDPNGPGRITSDGKKILFGFLATERDMEDADYKRKIVKRWSMESYAEKVLQPLNQCERDKEEAKKKREELTEEAKKKSRAVEHNKIEVNRAAAVFRKVHEEMQAWKKQEEDLEAKHRRTFEERKKHFELEKLQKLESFKERERNIRVQLQQNNVAKQDAVIQFEELARRLKDGIDMEKKKHALRSAEQQQLEMLDRVKLASSLQSVMEKRLAMLEERFQERALKLQKQHNEQIIKSREKLTMEKERFLEEKLQELKKIEKESEEARTVTTETQREIERECIICFCDMVEEKRERALFGSCGHANICSKCAHVYWKEERSKGKDKPICCPTCKTVQAKKFSLLPATIYT